MAQASLYSAQYTTGVPSVGYSTASYTASGAAEIPIGQRMITGGNTGAERIQSTRKVSSTIINEQYLGPTPQDLPTKEVYVQGPPVEEVKYVTRKEVREVEKRVPKYEYEWVEKIVEIPRVEYVEKKVDKVQYVDKIVEKKIPQIIDVPQEVIREVKIPKINYREKEVQVPGEIIQVPKPYRVNQAVYVNQYTDRQVPLVVAQTIRPVVVEGHGVHEVDVYEYEPECVPVDVHVIKPVASQISAAGAVETLHRVVTVPAAQYNTILTQLNMHLTDVEKRKLPYLTSANGQITVLQERIAYVQPQVGITIQGWHETAPHIHKEPAPAAVAGQTMTSVSHTPSVSVSGAYQTAGAIMGDGASYYSGSKYVGGPYVTRSGYQQTGATYQQSGATYHQGPVQQTITTTTTNYPTTSSEMMASSYSPSVITRPALTAAPLVAH